MYVPVYTHIARAFRSSRQFFAYDNLELPQTLTTGYVHLRSAYIVNGLPSPDELPAALIMFIFEKNYSLVRRRSSEYPFIRPGYKETLVTLLQCLLRAWVRGYSGWW